jgi:hypothetical protein
MNRSIPVVIKTKTVQCTLSQRVCEFNSLQLQTRSWSSPSWTSLGESSKVGSQFSWRRR